ncbi:ABC transporter ATP-binding protein [Roseomonas rosulenta]|uniref:ABC transporter ATP-binding protein n=1 Tax=Roseomonas rosulenta TaxID=2748667 RepID=UPI0018DF90DA|nr:ABC transporter ATP-binding protein [Roseomonas rosulenta]
MTALAVEGLTGGYAAADHVVKGVSFTVAAGELLCVIGPNGAGKSTVLKLMTGLLRPRAGRVLLGGREVTGLAPRAMIEAGLVLVPQERNVFGTLTVEENLVMGCFLDPRRARARMAAVTDRFPLLAERRRQAARTLSGGQRQILAMGQALMSEPRVLLLDEPTAGLSPKAAADLFALVRATADSGVAVLMVEQNALQAMQASDRALVLVDGRNAHEGPAPALACDPGIRRMFLGGRGAGSMDATGTYREPHP